MKRALPHRLIVLLAPLLLGACDILGSDDDNFLLEQIDRAEALWDSTSAASYTLVVTRRCDCGIDPRQVSLEVVDDEIVAAIYTDAQEPVAAADWNKYLTVQGLFDIARDAVRRKVPVILLEYNQEFGYINDLIINYDRSRIDDDVLYRVDGYAANTGT